MNLNPMPFLKRQLAKAKALLHRLGNDAADTLPAGAPAPATAPTADRVASAAQSLDGRFQHRFGTRDYRLYLPPRAAGQPPALRPLLLMLHGCNQTPDDFATGTRMHEAACAAGFLVLYPAQSAFANLHRCWNWFKRHHQQRDRGEAALLADLTREVQAAHGVDPARICVAGLSAGGAMAAVLGDVYPELFAAVGLHSGVPTGLASDMLSAMAVMKTGPRAPAVRTSAPPPTIVFHGDQDTVVHPANADAAMRPFATLGTRETRQGLTDQGAAYTVHRIRTPAGRVVAEQWMVRGTGHAWSGGSAAGSYTAPSGPDATAAMVAFFQGQAAAASRQFP
ncbi:PHB depolymerase family esterase [Sphaerotilus sp.]|uniref:extracellular catalytic domain type 1 short-chain-length polyhydroxyalkanoate depolymerase n=1 Tax=Sphaerotilus sp. TaxID=2093942 RepID=UPI002ACEBEA6|nr:PHB depolymerase family esterase [Sphaerotilus sp.]MDZ7856167.1 PHB depolymerase family esterase [Sphaerotilus sp.]